MKYFSEGKNTLEHPSQFISRFRTTISPRDAKESDLCSFTSCGRVACTLKRIP